MAVNKKLMEELSKLEGAVNERRNIHATVIGSRSPSYNFTFGNGWGLPFGYSLALYGPPKGGKSLISNAMIAQMHADYDDAVAIKYSTEFRENQSSPEQLQAWGIDLDRYKGYDVNSPDLIFDAIATKIPALIQKGLNVRMIVIDSLTGIMGRRAMNADSIMTQQIGDNAITIQEGLKMILPIQRKYGIAGVFTTQVRAEMDQLEQRRGNKVKMAASFGVQHHCEYFAYVEMDKTKDARSDLLGNGFTNENLKDLNDNEEKTGHKIRVQMKDSSMGPKGRVGEFTLDYDRGIVNTHEEVFLLGSNRGVIDRPNNLTYSFGDRKWAGKPAMLQALKEDRDLYEAVLKELRRRDMEGTLPPEPVVAAEESP